MGFHTVNVKEAQSPYPLSSWGHSSILDSGSLGMDLTSFLSDWVHLMILAVVSVVSTLMISLSALGFKVNRDFLSNEFLEVIWSLLPIMVLSSLMFPSLISLYEVDSGFSPSMTLKVIGNQWFWEYEYPELQGVANSSYMLQPEDPSLLFRNLDVDNGVPLPTKTPIRVITSSRDVIHSWAVPLLGLKVDSIPGRLNEASVLISKCGIMFGQCSEICGAYHSFMPVKIEAVSLKSFVGLI